MADITIHTADPGETPEALAAAQDTAAAIAHDAAHNAVQQHLGGAVTEAHAAAEDAAQSAENAAHHAGTTATEATSGTEALILSGFASMNENLKQLLDLQKQSQEGKKEEDDALETVDTDTKEPISGELDNGGPDTKGDQTTGGAKADPGADDDEDETEKDNAKKAKKVAAKDIQPKRRAGWRQKLLGSSGGLR